MINIKLMKLFTQKNYKKNYLDLQHLTDEEAVEHYYKHGIYEKRRFYLHP
jgi:hypothetical protein